MNGTHGRLFLYLAPRTLNEREWRMKFKSYVAFAVVAPFFMGVSAGWAQPRDHRMISLKDLKWGDVPSLLPGARIAVMQGPVSEAVRYIFLLKFAAIYSIVSYL